MIRCPYCNYKDDKSNFPDYFEDEEKIKSDLDDYGLHIVTCGMCGKAIVVEDFKV